MAGTFELQTDAVRDYLQKMAANVPQFELRETVTNEHLKDVRFDIKGSPGTADFVVVVNPRLEHFAFNVGAHIRFEGDWDAFPRTLDYFHDLVDAVMQGNVYETHFFLISPRINSAARVHGKILLARHAAFEFSEWLSFLPFLAWRKVQHRYRPY